MENKKLAKEVAFYTTLYLVGFSLWATAAVYCTADLVYMYKSNKRAKKMTNDKKNSEN